MIHQMPEASLLENTGVDVAMAEMSQAEESLNGCASTAELGSLDGWQYLQIGALCADLDERARWLSAADAHFGAALATDAELSRGLILASLGQIFLQAYGVKAEWPNLPHGPADNLYENIGHLLEQAFASPATVDSWNLPTLCRLLGLALFCREEGRAATILPATFAESWRSKKPDLYDAVLYGADKIPLAFHVSKRSRSSSGNPLSPASSVVQLHMPQLIDQALEEIGVRQPDTYKQPVQWIADLIADEARGEELSGLELRVLSAITQLMTAPLDDYAQNRQRVARTRNAMRRIDRTFPSVAGDTDGIAQENDALLPDQTANETANIIARITRRGTPKSERLLLAQGWDYLDLAIADPSSPHAELYFATAFDIFETIKKTIGNAKLDPTFFRASLALAYKTAFRAQLDNKPIDSRTHKTVGENVRSMMKTLLKETNNVPAHHSYTEYHQEFSELLTLLVALNRFSSDRFIFPASAHEREGRTEDSGQVDSYQAYERSMGNGNPAKIPLKITFIANHGMLSSTNPARRVHVQKLFSRPPFADAMQSAAANRDYRAIQLNSLARDLAFGSRARTTNPLVKHASRFLRSAIDGDLVRIPDAAD